ncbi:MAG: CspA family cold shock protein [Flavobacteriales bacterium]
MHRILFYHTLQSIIYFIFITMAKGTVKFFNESKGFGFIVDEENGNELFVHVSGLIDEIKENDEVTYDVADGRKGPNAVDVKLA